LRHIGLYACPALAAGAAALTPVVAAAQAPPPTPPPVAPDTASVALDRSCYAPGDPMVQTGRGFAPNASVLQIAGLTAPGGNQVLRALTATITTDASGGFRVIFRAPQLGRASDRTEDGVSIFTDPAVLQNPSATPSGPAVPWTLSARDVKIAQWVDRVADPAGTMGVDSTGWTRGHANLYAHYFRGTTRIRSVKLGALTGPCGTFKRRVKEFPFKGVKAGEWRVFFSDAAVLDKAKDPFVRRTVVVPRSKATA